MIDTNWYVITGPPCSGKTTLINLLKEQGYLIAPEVARQYYLDLIKRYDSDSVLSHPLQLQAEILQIEIEREMRLDESTLTFLDRAIPDSIAYYHRIGHVPDAVFEAATNHRYQAIFFLEALPYQNDVIRKEDEKTARILGDLIHQAYTGLGYLPIEIPAVSAKERVELILSLIKRENPLI